MASKRQPATAAPKVTSSPATSTVQQQLKIIPSTQQLKTTPPSPPPSGTSAQDIKEIMVSAVSQFREEMKQLLEQNKSESKEEMKKEMKELLEQNNTILRDDILLALSGVASVVGKLDSRVEEIEETVELLDYKFQDMEKKVETSQDDILMFQYRQMEYALRIRGLKEDKTQDLMEMVIDDLAVILNIDKDELRGEVERIYRVNSWIAKQRNLPRDVVIYFAKKSLRNQILQIFYNKRFQIAAQDIIILKEIPPKILRSRKDFAFLANELKARQMPFRWEIPMGIVLSHAGTRYRLNTVAKAKEFYKTVLGAGSPLPMMHKVLSDKEMEQKSEDTGAMTAGQVVLMSQAEVKEQRMTRAAHKRKEKEHQKKEKEIKESIQQIVPMPVGGARPKSSATYSSVAEFEGIFSRLKAKGDGKAPDLEC